MCVHSLNIFIAFLTVQLSGFIDSMSRMTSRFWHCSGNLTRQFSFYSSRILVECQLLWEALISCLRCCWRAMALRRAPNCEKIIFLWLLNNRVWSAKNDVSLLLHFSHNSLGTSNNTPDASLKSISSKTINFDSEEDDADISWQISEANLRFMSFLAAEKFVKLPNGLKSLSFGIN